ncbi:MAG: hypothetical protein M2R45_03933 [Verrucomicrobia subdivision 3 bacterium]|nr:hypothetical protein [Limisphaerales bacterium]MCS1417700.1 hypothetical protein [Limisphaerales bacterium]
MPLCGQKMLAPVSSNSWLGGELDLVQPAAHDKACLGRRCEALDQGSGLIGRGRMRYGLNCYLGQQAGGMLVCVNECGSAVCDLRPELFKKWWPLVFIVTFSWGGAGRATGWLAHFPTDR